MRKLKGARKMVTVAKERKREGQKGYSSFTRCFFFVFGAKFVQNVMQTFVNPGMLLHFFVKNYLGRTTFFAQNAPSSPAFQHQLYP